MHCPEKLPADIIAVIFEYLKPEDIVNTRNLTSNASILKSDTWHINFQRLFNYEFNSLLPTDNTTTVAYTLSQLMALAEKTNWNILIKLDLSEKLTNEENFTLHNIKKIPDRVIKVLIEDNLECREFIEHKPSFIDSIFIEIACLESLILTESPYNKCNYKSISIKSEDIADINSIFLHAGHASSSYYNTTLNLLKSSLCSNIFTIFDFEIPSCSNAIIALIIDCQYYGKHKVLLEFMDFSPRNNSFSISVCQQSSLALLSSNTKYYNTNLKYSFISDNLFFYTDENSVVENVKLHIDLFSGETITTKYTRKELWNNAESRYNNVYAFPIRKIALDNDLCKKTEGGMNIYYKNTASINFSQLQSVRIEIEFKDYINKFAIICFITESVNILRVHENSIAYLFVN